MYILEGFDCNQSLVSAVNFIKHLLCAKTHEKSNKFVKSPLFCGECQSCIAVDNNVHPDFIKIEPEGNIISINQIRDINVSIKPQIGEYVIYLFPDAAKIELKTQNALLKMIEEPPFFVLFILITDDIKKLLPTIISRCNVIKFKSYSLKYIRGYVESKYGHDVDLITKFSFRFLDRADYLIENIEKLKEDIKYFNSGELEKTGGKDFLEIMLELYKDKLLEYLKEGNLKLAVWISKNIDFLIETKKNIELKANEEIALKYLFLRCYIVSNRSNV